MRASGALPGYVADTHAIIWHLESDSRLSTEARRRFEEAERGEAVIYISAISVAEIILLHERGRLPRHGFELFKRALQSRPFECYQVADLTYELALGLENVPRQIVPELPDRIIAATAHFLGLPLLTRDTALQNWEGIITIW